MMFGLEDNYYGEILADKDDVIMRHADEKYDHIRLLYPATVEATDGEVYELLTMRAVFLGNIALAAFASHGLPEAYLDEPTDMTVRAYENDVLGRLDFDNE